MSGVWEGLCSPLLRLPLGVPPMPAPAMPHFNDSEVRGSSPHLICRKWNHGPEASGSLGGRGGVLGPKSLCTKKKTNITFPIVNFVSEDCHFGLKRGSKGVSHGVRPFKILPWGEN